MTVTSKIETERKYDVDEGTQVPDLTAVGPVEVQETFTLRATYFDTANGALANRLIALRHRTGGGDEGWHLKTPGIGGRTEHHSELQESVPDGIRDLVEAVIRGQELVEIARLSTQRTVIHIFDEQGRAIVEVADDLVSATDVESGILRLWREWEAELLDGAPNGRRKREAVLDAVEAVLLGAGATRSKSASKLARALGRDSLAQSPGRHTAPNPSDGSLNKASPALQVVLVVLEDLIEALIAADPAARQDVPDGVHAMRVIVRRIRSVLATFSTVLEASVAGEIRERLGVLGSVLGATRDAEVRHDRALALLGELTSPDVDIHRRLIEDAAGERAVRHTDLLAYLDSAEYFSLLDDLERLLDRPPVTDYSMRPAGTELRASLVHQINRTDHLLGGAKRKDLDALHDARKAARRLRYAVEAVTSPPAPIFGKKFVHLGEMAHLLQDSIGENRDAALFLDQLETVMAEATEAGESTGGYAALERSEKRAARAALENVKGLRKQFRDLA